MTKDDGTPFDNGGLPMIDRWRAQQHEFFEVISDFITVELRGPDSVKCLNAVRDAVQEVLGKDAKVMIAGIIRSPISGITEGEII